MDIFWDAMETLTIMDTNTPPILNLPVELLDIILDMLGGIHDRVTDYEELFLLQRSISHDILNFRLVCKWFSGVGRRAIRRELIHKRSLSAFHFDFHFRHSEVWQLDALSKTGAWKDLRTLNIHLPDQQDWNDTERKPITAEIFTKAVSVMGTAVSNMKFFDLQIRADGHTEGHSDLSETDTLERLKLHRYCWDFIKAILPKFEAPRTLWKLPLPRYSLNISGQVLHALSFPAIQRDDWMDSLTCVGAWSVPSNDLVKLASILAKAKLLSNIFIRDLEGGRLERAQLFHDQQWPNLRNFSLRNTAMQLVDLLRILRPDSVFSVNLENVELLDGTWRDLLEKLLQRLRSPEGEKRRRFLCTISFSEGLYQREDIGGRHGLGDIIKKHGSEHHGIALPVLVPTMQPFVSKFYTLDVAKYAKDMQQPPSTTTNENGRH